MTLILTFQHHSRSNVIVVFYSPYMISYWYLTVTWPNSPPLQVITFRILSDLDIDLSRSLRANVIIPIDSQYMLSYQCLITYGLTGLLYKILGFRIWVPLILTFQGHSRSNVMVSLDSPYMAFYSIILDLALYDPFGVDMPLNFDITHSIILDYILLLTLFDWIRIWPVKTTAAIPFLLFDHLFLCNPKTCLGTLIDCCLYIIKVVQQLVCPDTPHLELLKWHPKNTT